MTSIKVFDTSADILQHIADKEEMTVAEVIDELLDANDLK